MSKFLCRSVGSRFPHHFLVSSGEAPWGGLGGKEGLRGCGPAGSVLTRGIVLGVLEAAVPGSVPQRCPTAPGIFTPTLISAVIQRSPSSTVISCCSCMKMSDSFAM